MSTKGKDHYRYKHGLTNHPLFKRWQNMIQRCYNPNDSSFKDYGGRGIKVCPEWLSDAERYISYVLSLGWKSGYTIDRRNNNGDYTPDNIRLATLEIQGNNRRTNRILEYKGVSDTLANWAKAKGLCRKVLRHRIEVGWTIEEALETPVQKEHVEYRGKKMTFSELSKKTGILEATLRYRILMGYTVDDAINKPLAKNKGILFEHNGKKMNLSQWCRELGVNRNTLNKRMRKGLSIEEALFTPVDPSKKHSP